MKDALSSAQQARREFLEKAGKLALYTPPTLMVLMHPGPHAIASGGNIKKEKEGKKVKKVKEVKK